VLHTLIEQMTSKEAPEKQPSAGRCALTVVLDTATGRASIIEDPTTSPEIAKVLEEMSRDGVERTSSGGGTSINR
jgi:hypothetical protein